MIAYEGRGAAGPPVLLVHGFPLDRGMWRGQLDGLSAIARVVAIDLPGFGDTPPANDGRAPFTMDAAADAVIAVADALGFARFVLGGLSMGGYVAFAILRRHAHRLLGLALCDTRAEADTPDTQRGRLADAERALAEGPGFLVEPSLERLLAAETFTLHPEIVKTVEVMMRRSTAAGVAGMLRGMAERPDARGLLRGIAVPTIVIAGAADVITPPDGAQKLAAAIPGAEFAVIPAAGHVAPLEAPDATNAALRRLIRRASAAA